MTSREKVIYAEQQVRAILSQEVAVIQCPFCDTRLTFDASDNEHDLMLCCEPLGAVVDAILTHVEAIDQKKQLDEIADRYFSERRPPPNLVSLN
jgi:hypothetical protein